MKTKKFGSIVLIFGMFIFWACEGPEGPQGPAGPEGPVLAINTINATPFNLNPGNTATVTADYIYSGDGTLEFIWESTDGTFIGETNSAIVQWNSPLTPGYYTISLTISDGENEAIGHCTIQVIDPYDSYWCDVPAGQYTYGLGDEILTIDYDFQIMKYEVTNQQYVDYLEEALSQEEITVTTSTVEGYYPGDGHWDAGDYEFLDLDNDDCRIDWTGTDFSIISGYEDHPVVYVTWFGSWAFAEHFGFELPTEQEWEKAARGSTGYDYPWGDDIDGSRANYWNSGDPFEQGVWAEYPQTTPVGMYNGQTIQGFSTTNSPSSFGAYDMAGNVWNWTYSWWSDTSSSRVMRGGGWYNGDTNDLRSWLRVGLGPPVSADVIGFRCVRP